jgi:hypothetical protein
MKLLVPTRKSQAYLSAWGIAAIYIAAGGPYGDDPVVGVSRNLRRAAQMLAPRELVAVFWTHAERDARRVAALAASDPTVAGIQEIAERLAIPLSDHATTLARVQHARQRLAAVLDVARASGALSAFNRDYRAARLSAAARGQNFPTYAKALCALEDRPSIFHPDVLRILRNNPGDERGDFRRLQPGRLAHRHRVI